MENIYKQSGKVLLHLFELIHWYQNENIAHLKNSPSRTCITNCCKQELWSRVHKIKVQIYSPLDSPVSDAHLSHISLVCNLFIGPITEFSRIQFFYTELNAHDLSATLASLLIYASYQSSSCCKVICHPQYLQVPQFWENQRVNIFFADLKQAKIACLFPVLIN